MYCSKCGSKISNSHGFCTNCGEKITLNNENTNFSSKSISVNNPKKLKYGVLFIAICVILGAFLLFSTHKAPKDLIIGKWTCVSKGDNLSLEFMKNGTVNIAENNGKGEAYNYTIENKTESKNSITIKISKANNSSYSETSTIIFKDKNNMILNDGTSSTLDFTRSK